VFERDEVTVSRDEQHRLCERADSRFWDVGRDAVHRILLVPQLVELARPGCDPLILFEPGRAVHGGGGDILEAFEQARVNAVPPERSR